MTGAIALIAAGCTTLPPQRPATVDAPQLRPREIAATFIVSGRIAARDVGDSKRGFSGGFSWNHGLSDDVIEILTPLGQIAARLTLTSAGATVEMADGQRTTTADPEAFVQRLLGIRLPIRALPYWMQAAPIPGVPVRFEADAAGRLTMLWQDGWEIRYGAYASDAFNANPTRLDLVQGNVEARILIAEWNAR